MPKKTDAENEILLAKLDLFKDHFDSHLSDVKGTLNRMDERLDKIDVTSAAQGATLEEHVRRTNLLEEKIEVDKKIVESKLEPIQAHVTQVKIFMKIAGLVLGGGTLLGGAGVGIKKLIDALFGG